MTHPGPTALKVDTFQIEPRPGSKKLIIFFSATGAQAGKFNFWKEGSVLPCHRIFINNGSNEWYQNGVPGLGSTVEETVETLKKWVDALGATEIYTCGGSMGAYAAILYGTLLGARVLSFAAETTLGIEGSRSVSHIRKGTVLRFPELRGFIEKSPQPIFHYAGEMDPVDVYCAAKLKDTPNIKLTTLIGIDHGPPRYIRDVGLLPTFLQRFIANKPMPTVPGEGDVLKLDRFPDLFLAAFQALKVSDWARAEREGLEALEIHPTSDYCRFIVSLAQSKLGKPLPALENIGIAMALARPSTEQYDRIRIHLALCLRSVGDAKRGAEVYSSLIERDGSNHRAHYGLGLCLEKMKQKEAAAAAYEKALSLSPLSAPYAKRLGILRQPRVS